MREAERPLFFFHNGGAAVKLDSKAPCDLCRKPRGPIQYDASTKPYGQWAWLCPRCFSHYAYGLGTGMGQKYELQDDGQFKKTGG